MKSQTPPQRSGLFLSILFLLWMTVLLASFFIVQKPALLGILSGIGRLILGLLSGGLFIAVSSGMGYSVLHKLWDAAPNGQRFLLSTGAGMGLMGIIGFACAGSGIASGWLMFSLQAILFLILIASGKFSVVLQDLRELTANLHETSRHVPRWVPMIAVSYLFLVLILSLAPPFEAFDGLLYHLTIPSLWIRNGGLSTINMPHYWFPALMEGMFVFPMSLGFDFLTQWIHLCFGILCCLLIWDWTRLFVDERAAWWSIAILLSMPSLPLLASWAYTDLGLAFYSISALVLLINWKSTGNRTWLWFSGGMSGFAMGIKYTSFVLPLVILVFIVLYSLRNKQRLLLVAGYSAAAMLTGGIWYLRNWIWMGNPIYPFVFGGLFWDPFRAAWYAGSGTGIGWNFFSILSMPFVTMLGYMDQNYFDGRMGPLYLVLLPVSLIVLWKNGKQRSTLGGQPLFIFAIFGAATSLVWLIGVIQSMSLMQSRLLFPGLIAFVPMMAAGILELKSLDMPRFRSSFIFSAVTGITILFFLLDFATFVWARNPMAAALGVESMETYIGKVHPEYLEALTLVEQSPPDAFIYFVKEARSYGMTRNVQPDPIHDNLPHDFYLYPTNSSLLDSWRELGCTHVLFRKHIITEEDEDNLSPDRLEELLNLLPLVEETENYSLFAVPPEK